MHGAGLCKPPSNGLPFRRGGPIYEQTSFSAEVPLPVRPAPYAALGDALETALLLLALAVFALALFTRDPWRR